MFYFDVCIAVLHPEVLYRRQGPPPGYQGGPPKGFEGGPPKGFEGGPPPGYEGGPPKGFEGGPPKGFEGGPPPGYEGGPPKGFEGGLPQENKGGMQGDGGDEKSGTQRPKLLQDDDVKSFTSTPATTKRKRTTPPRMSFEEECDYLAFYCLKAYNTGKVCGRTIYYNYQDFKNYCMLDYVNCMERYEVWQVVHMGECFNLTRLKDYQHYEYHDDLFLDEMYVIEQ